MDIKEITGNMFNNFLRIFFCITMVTSISFRVLSFGELNIEGVFAITVLSALCACIDLVFYSKKELNKLELLARHIISLIITAVLVVVFDRYMAWGFTASIFGVIVLVGMILVAYTVSVIIDYYHTAKSTSALAKKIKELNEND